jgi:hypothetical protein
VISCISIHQSNILALSLPLTFCPPLSLLAICLSLSLSAQLYQSLHLLHLLVNRNAPTRTDLGQHSPTTLDQWDLSIKQAGEFLCMTETSRHTGLDAPIRQSRVAG